MQVDETFIGGKGKQKTYHQTKKLVIGIMENGGELVTRVVASTKKVDLLPHVQNFVLPGTEIHTDECSSYRLLHTRGYVHKYQFTALSTSPDGTHINALEGFLHA